MIHRFFFISCLIGLIASTDNPLAGQDANEPNEVVDIGIPEGIVWHGRLQQGLDVAKRTGKPIFLLSAAPNCVGVSGIW